jgi:HEAT repeat protein
MPGGREKSLTADEVRQLASYAVAHLDDLDAEGEPVRARAAMVDLQQRGGVAALLLCDRWRGGTDKQRRVAAWILGELRADQETYAEQRFQLLAAMLAQESSGAGDLHVLNGILTALGHLRDPRAIPLALDLLRHPHEEVRFGAMCALSGHDDARAIAGLVTLSADACGQIRDWATFEIGAMCESDTPALREALIARVHDPISDVRHEAIFGLARRGDPRALPLVAEALGQNELSRPLLDAAARLADRSLCPALLRAWGGEPGGMLDGCAYDLRGEWDEAFAACGCKKTD